MENQFMTASQTAKKWGITQRRVQVLCQTGRINSAFKLGEAWVIPTTTEKPIDGRKRKGSDNV